jgi:predicted ATP-dependent endonuclease of OLD family
MKLVFCWIEEYKNIKEQGFNFGSEYIFEVIKEDNTLEIDAKQNESFISGFFKINGNGFDNVTAIVGENGVGKSNVLKLLIDIFEDRNTYRDSLIEEIIDETFTKTKRKGVRKKIYLKKYLIVFQNEKKEYEVFNNSDYKISSLSKFKFKVQTKFPTHNLIYYNPILDFSIFPSQFDSRNYIDISSNWLLHMDRVENNETKGYFDQATIHKFQNIFRLLDFFEESKLKYKIKLPKEVSIILTENESVLERDYFKDEKLNEYGLNFKFIGYHDTSYNFRDHFSAILYKTELEKRQMSKELSEIRKSRNNNYDKKWIEHIHKSLKLFFYEFLIINLISNIETTNHYLEEGYVYFNESKYKELSIRESIILFIENQFFSSKRLYYKDYKTLLSYEELYPRKEILNLIHVIEKIIDSIKYFDDDLMNWQKVRFDISTANGKELLLVYRQYINAMSKVAGNHGAKGFINFNFDVWLSSGELAYLNFFSRLYYAKNKLKTNPLYIYLLIDEGEIGFHLQWQKEYIKSLIDYIPKVLGPVNCEIQLIYATHSPITLSDIPHNHIIYLEKEIDENGQNKCMVLKSKNKQSFGANFYDILQDGFYFKDSFTGDFANEKIQKLLIS